ncbi:gliding motility-associated C-terminal domain-containing protein [Hymenobacter sediminicola]|uniref:Gliding motility-associated C-terminal domain-containing protein n=1 Tax=Hymenobacter sediminicola TaxID=2761579 RepID=A0A7G7W630_9BACT|nr:gliding motility-associated C-terminal domain-containing protein [Hymenobacter sediminicola]QNH61823.1 gliding motility-associated C-terminal domain-containing protein [Hymenobacter sediminicola]
MLLSTVRFFCAGFLLAAIPISYGLANPIKPGAVAPETASLEFVENKGQWDGPARYAAALPSGRLFLTPTGFTYSFLDPKALGHHAGKNEAGVAPKPSNPDELRGHAYTVTFEGANPAPTMAGEQGTPAPYNYFRGKDPKRWASNARGFRRLRYTNLYPGIEAVLYENAAQKLEYDFEVAPGGKPAVIRMRYTGLDKLSLTSDGSLLAQTSVGDVTEQAPKAWQEINGQRVAVPCAFELQGNTISFRLGKYDRRRALTIDPTVIFSSFTGSQADNWGFTATYDAQGNMYSGGAVFDSGFPISPGAFRTTFSGGTDVGIIKYNTAVSGSAARLYATYVGGNSAEVPHSMVVNPQGELVILGSTGSNNFPVTAGAYDITHNGGPQINPDNDYEPLKYHNGADLFIAKLSANGTTLLGSTYVGGSGTDGVVSVFTAGGTVDGLPGSPVVNYGDQFRGDVTTDGDGNIYVASVTSSPNFPTPNGYRTSFQGGSFDAVVLKLSADVRSLLWSTYLGGANSDAAYSLQVDATHGVYVAGGTLSTNFPTTTGTAQPTFRGILDGFITHLSSTGSSVLQSSYIGTTAYDQAFFVQLDAASNVYLLGQTQGNIPISPGLYGAPNGRQFIQKLDPALSNTLYSTRFGSGSTLFPDISLSAFLVDDCERIYISGWGGRVNDPGVDDPTIPRNFSSTLGLPVTANAIQGNTDGSDFYLAQFRPGMTALEYATFYGEQGGRGEHVDGGTSRFDKKGVIYQAVCGGCGGTSAFPIPPGANTYSATNRANNCNNAAFKIDFGIIVADPGPSRYVCVNSAPLALTGSPAGGTWTGPGVTAIPGGGYQFTPVPARLGVNILTYSVASTGTCVSTRPLKITVTPERPVAITPVPPKCVTSGSVNMVATPAGGTFSGPGISGNVFNPATAGIGTHTLVYLVSDTLGCGVGTQTVVVSQLPQVQAGPDTTLCADQTNPFQLRGMTPAGGTWSGTGVTPSGLFTPPNTNNRGGIFSLTYNYTSNSCTNSDTRTVLLAPTSAANVSLNLPECAASPRYTGLAPFTCQFEPILPGGSYDWDFGDGSPHSTEISPSHLYENSGTYNVRLVARYAGCVVETAFAPVVVGDILVPNIITPNGDSLNDSFKPRFSCKPTRLQVFNRWGTMVFETKEYHNNWGGQGLPNGIYYYLLRDTDNRRAKGWVEITR